MKRIGVPAKYSNITISGGNTRNHPITMLHFICFAHEGFEFYLNKIRVLVQVSC